VQTYTERCKAALGAEGAAALSPAVRALRPIDALPPGAPVDAFNVVAQEIFESEQAPRLLRHFSEQPEALEALRHAPPSHILRVIAKLESRFEADSSAAPAPPSRTITKAPEPPPTLGSRAAAPVNEAEAALARGDFKAYRAAKNREEMAARS
jgi:hypothetical protein